LLLRDGNYLFYCVSAANIDYSDLNNKAIKRAVRDKVFALPFLLERGLFVHGCGARSRWKDGSKNLEVDKTALRPIILQNINFIDPACGESFNIRTSWGSLKFGFSGKVIEAIEVIGEQIREGANRGATIGPFRVRIFTTFPTAILHLARPQIRRASRLDVLKRKYFYVAYRYGYTRHEIGH